MRGVEVEGEVTVPADDEDKGRVLRFKADLVYDAAGQVRLCDYKTGKPISEAVLEKTRQRTLAARVSAGLALQGAAYRLAAGPDAAGEYAFLRPELDPERARLGVTAENTELEQGFRSAVQVAGTGIDRGVFFPRLLEADGVREPGRCEFCELAEACLRGDSGARQRLARFAEREPRTSESDAEHALLDLWPLGAGGW